MAFCNILTPNLKLIILIKLDKLQTAKKEEMWVELVFVLAPWQGWKGD